MNQNKKGVSDVVTTVLIIMLTIAAIGVIAGFVVPFVKESLQKSTECKDYQGFYTFDESFKLNCNINNIYTFSIKTIGIGAGESNFSIGKGENTTNYTVSANKVLAENVAGIKLILTKSDGTTKSAEINSTSDSIVMYGGETFALPEPGEIRSYNYSSADEFKSAEVYPILKNGRICADVKESIEIKPCG